MNINHHQEESVTLHSSRMNGETLAIRDEQNNVLNVNNKKRDATRGLTKEHLKGWLSCVNVKVGENIPVKISYNKKSQNESGLHSFRPQIFSKARIYCSTAWPHE